MRVKAGRVIVEPWINDTECIECLKSRKSIIYVLREPLIAYSTLYMKGKEVLRGTQLVLAHGSYIVRDAEDALTCSCTFAIIEKDSWGEIDKFEGGGENEVD